MYLFLYNSIIYNADDVETIKDLKQYIIDNFKNIHKENLTLSYTMNKTVLEPDDVDELIPNILYTLTITPIECDIHLC